MIKKLLSMSLLLVAAVVLTGCDRDEEMAETLDGIWEGQVSQTFFTHRGYASTYQDVDIEFYKDPYSFAQGDGIEYDYDPYSWYYTYCRFNYHVSFGVIYIDYEDGTRVAVNRRSLTDRIFAGTFCDYYTGRYLADFNFVKVANWRYYGNPNWRYETYGRAKARRQAPCVVE